MVFLTIIAIIVFLFAYLSDSARSSYLTQERKEMSGRLNEMTYYDYNAKYERDVVTGKLASRRTTSFYEYPEYDKLPSNLRPSIEFVITKPDIVGNQRVLRARWFGGPDHGKEIPLSQAKEISSHLAKFIY